MKKVAVIGLGRFGYNIACKLAEEGLDVLAIDDNREVVQQIRDNVSQAVIANATDRDTLKSLGVDEADTVIVSLGERLDNAMLVLLFLKEFGVPHIVIKANSADQSKIFAMMGAHEVLEPEKEVAIRMGERLARPNVLERLVFAENHSIAEIKAPPLFIGKTLKDLGVRAKFGVVVAAIKKETGNKINIAPSADDVIVEGDRLVVVGHDDNIDRLKKV